MRKVRTVLGDIYADIIGFTYSHEHLYTMPPENQLDRDLEISDYNKSLLELRSFKTAGGNTLVEASTIDYGRNIRALVQLSQAAGVNIVATTGFNKHIYYPDWVESKTIDEIADILITDITVGIDGTTHKAGVLKGGSYYNLIAPLEKKTTVAIAKAQKRTNAPVWIHTEAGTMSWEMLQILLENGVPSSAIVIGHMDRNLDWYHHERLLKNGVYVQFDGPGKVKYYPDSFRVNFLQRYKQEGYLNQLLISGDMGRTSYLCAYGGGPGFEFILKKFIPRLLSEGFNKEDIDTIFIKNAARWLARF